MPPILLRSRRPLRPPRSLIHLKPHLHQTRPFSLPFLSDLTSTPTPKTLRTSKTLPYPSELLYKIISDIDSYSSFLPFCTSSRVHAWTVPKPPVGRCPALATLTVGWGPFTAESYTSRVYCVPGSVVEAVSGSAEPSTDRELLRAVGYDGDGEQGGWEQPGDLFKSLVTRWDVKPAVGKAHMTTDVSLSIRYLFANPLHQVAVGGVADEVADKMIRAFEARAEKLYDGWARQEPGRI
jgi:coenzyme Q-binding protein COQ10